jgi:hypothetical protein
MSEREERAERPMICEPGGATSASGSEYVNGERCEP